MTRISSFGRKRTYLQAHAQENSTDEKKISPELHPGAIEPRADAPPPKKKRKRTPKSKRDGYAENNATTICFACREKGHPAKDCPKSGVDADSKSRPVGMCYRCGSPRHTLSRCKKSQDPSNPLPHASCFVCNRKGHLASACPQNKSKGIYPNGGTCKLCGDVTHLAKDCSMRNKDPDKLTAVLGIKEVDLGADEDDFHVIGRRKQELDRLDKKSEKLERAKVGAHFSVVKSLGSTSTMAKKVVFF